MLKLDCVVAKRMFRSVNAHSTQKISIIAAVKSFCGCSLQATWANPYA